MSFEHFDETSAGAYLGGKRPISPRTMQRWRIEGGGPEFIRIGHAVRYTKDALDAFILSSTQSTTTQAERTAQASVERVRAAAADLLKALQECLRELGGRRAVGEPARMARAAIAKATGAA